MRLDCLHSFTTFIVPLALSIPFVSVVSLAVVGSMYTICIHKNNIMVFCSGPHTKYLGRGDLHDPKYDDMSLRRNFFDLDMDSSVQSRHTGIPLSTNYCTFYTNIFPSKERSII